MTRPVRALAAAVVLVLAGDAVGLAVVAPSDEPPAGPPPAQAAAIRRVVPAIEQFVARERGLAFTHHVKVQLLGDKAFVRRLQAGSDKARAKDTAALAKAEGFLRALHLIEGDVHLDSAVDRLLSSAVAGYYDPKTKALVVRGADPTPSVRAVLAHELTHALQDQHFGLERPALDRRTDEAAQGFTGLVEGDAVRVQRAYYAALPPAEQRQLVAEEGEVRPPSGVPEVLVEVLLFPYRVGPPFVDAVLQAGGQGRLDAAFAAPPETSEQLLHPDAFLRGDRPRAVTVPRADGTVSDRGVVGELGLLLLLGRDLGSQVAQQAAQGWGGDRYVAWRRGATTCVRARFVMDTPRDTAELGSALRRWAAKHDGVTVAGSGEGPLTLTSCA